MRYRAHIYFDFSETAFSKPNSRSQELHAALIQAGWTFMATRRFVRDAQSLPEVWSAIDVLARQADRLGNLSFCSFHVESIPERSRDYVAKKNHPRALKKVMARPFPSLG